MNVADLVNTPYTGRLDTALAKLREQDGLDGHAIFCDRSHTQKWGTVQCVTCLVPFTAAPGSKRAALFLKQDPGGIPFAEMWVSNGAGGHVVVKLDAAGAMDLGSRLVAVAAFIGAHQ